MYELDRADHAQHQHTSDLAQQHCCCDCNHLPWGPTTLTVTSSSRSTLWRWGSCSIQAVSCPTSLLARLNSTNVYTFESCVCSLNPLLVPSGEPSTIPWPLAAVTTALVAEPGLVHGLGTAANIGLPIELARKSCTGSWLPSRRPKAVMSIQLSQNAFARRRLVNATRASFQLSVRKATEHAGWNRADNQKEIGDIRGNCS